MAVFISFLHSVSSKKNAHVDVDGMCEAQYGLKTFERSRDERPWNYAVLFVNGELWKGAIKITKELS